MRSHPRKTPKAAGFILLAALALPSAVSAQEPGLHIEPDSPAGIEYALPLERARDQGGSGANDRVDPSGQASGTAVGPYFGVGIQRASGGDPNAGSAHDEGSRSLGRPQGRADERNSGGDSPKAGTVAAALEASNSNQLRVGFLLALGIATLVLASWSLKRRLSSNSGDGAAN